MQRKVDFKKYTKQFYIFNYLNSEITLRSTNTANTRNARDPGCWRAVTKIHHDIMVCERDLALDLPFTHNTLIYKYT